MRVVFGILALFLIATETVFAAPLLDMANIPDYWEQMLVAFGLVAGCVVCLEHAIASMEKAKTAGDRAMPLLIFLFLAMLLSSFGLMRGLMTYTLSHGQLQMFLMGVYWLNLVFWGLITFLPPLAAALLIYRMKREAGE